MEDLYNILGVPPTATYHQIKENYQKLILHYHPDRSHSSDASIFIKVNNAYKILGDEHLRKEYDEKWKERCSKQFMPIDKDVDFKNFVYDDEEQVFCYECRCGGEFLLTSTDAELNFDIVCCDSCSLTIRVKYTGATNAVGTGVNPW